MSNSDIGHIHEAFRFLENQYELKANPPEYAEFLDIFWIEYGKKGSLGIRVIRERGFFDALIVVEDQTFSSNQIASYLGVNLFAGGDYRGKVGIRELATAVSASIGSILQNKERLKKRLIEEYLAEQPPQ